MIRGETRSNPDSIRFCELASAVMKLQGRTSDVTPPPPPKPTLVLSCYVLVASLPQIKRHLQRYFRGTKGLSPKSIFPSWSLCTAELHSRAARDPAPAQRRGWHSRWKPPVLSGTAACHGPAASPEPKPAQGWRVPSTLLKARPCKNEAAASRAESGASAGTARGMARHSVARHGTAPLSLQKCHPEMPAPRHRFGLKPAKHLKAEQGSLLIYSLIHQHPPHLPSRSGPILLRSTRGSRCSPQPGYSTHRPSADTPPAPAGPPPRGSPTRGPPPVGPAGRGCPPGCGGAGRHARGRAARHSWLSLHLASVASIGLNRGGREKKENSAQGDLISSALRAGEKLWNTQVVTQD